MFSHATAGLVGPARLTCDSAAVVFEPTAATATQPRPPASPRAVSRDSAARRGRPEAFR